MNEERDIFVQELDDGQRVRLAVTGELTEEAIQVLQKFLRERQKRRKKVLDEED